MPRTRIKFCGITRVEDALAASELGADAIGMVLHANSKRQIDTQTAHEILKSLPPFVTPVGLFVDASADELRAAIEQLGLRHIQLHGNETPELAAQFSDRVIIKALHVKPETFATEIANWKTVRAILLETATDQPGGTGVENNWDFIAEQKSRGTLNDLPPIIAAGGLRTDNVFSVVRKLRPWAVDVSSGIEESVGVKSRGKMSMFIEAVRAADATGIT